MAKIKDSELKLIKELEKEIGKELPEIPLGSMLKSTNNGYAVDENGNVGELTLDDSELEAIPSGILEIEHLKGISFFKNKISDISVLAGLSQLTTLNLTSNDIIDISVLAGLSQLTSLDLDSNDISDISVLAGLSQLTSLLLRNNNISDISVLAGLNQLTSLDLSKNDISDISVLARLSQLTSLNLDSNDIIDISVLAGLSQLTSLDLSYNNISDISVLAGLSQLTSLNLSYNKISDISVLAGLSQLTSLDLSSNDISDISVLAGLSQLTRLDLSKNQITTLPKSILDLNMELTVDTNFLVKGKFCLYGNPLESPPPEIIRKGKDAIRDYFKSLKKGKELPLNEVKVLLVGDGEAGKTSLVKQLLGKQFDEHERQTDGINIDLWPVTCGDTKITTRLWDFGGQEIMHATHQFFLSQRSLYILVLDGRKDDKTDYWLKHIKSFGGDSPVLIVLNKIDQNKGYDVPRTQLIEKYPNIKGFYRVSCATGDGLESFSNALKQAIDSVEIKSTQWGETWFKVKETLEKMKDDFIGYKKYRQICSDAGVPEGSGRETLIEFLNDLGVIVHFKDFDLKGTHILQPRWVTEAVYKIINSQQLADAKGVLDLRHLDDILKQEEDDDFYYPPEKHRFIIKLMKKFELCYELDDKKILVPSLLDVDQPDYDFDEKDALAFIVQYDFLPPSVMPRFIVKMHKDIHGCCQWRTGVVLSDKDYRSTAVVKADIDSRCIYFYVNGPQKRDYFAVLLTVLRRINGNFKKLKTTELIPLPDAPHLTADYKQLIRHEEHGIAAYLPGDSEKVYYVKDLLGALRVNTLSEEDLLQMISKSLPEDENKASTLEKVNDTLLDAFKFNPRFLGLEVDVNAIVKKLRAKKNKGR